MTLETGIFLSQAIWLWRVRHIRAEAKKVGMTYDEYIDAHPSKKLKRSTSSETVLDVEAGHIESPQLPEKTFTGAAIASLPDLSTGTEHREETSDEKLVVPEKAAAPKSDRK